MKAPAKLLSFAGVFFCLAAKAVAAPAPPAAAVRSGGSGPCDLGTGDSPDATLACAVLRARAAGLARDRMWQVLLHYRPTLTGGWKSAADGLGFFVAGKEGRTAPETELVATLTALFRTPANAPELKQPQCLFPARTAWLRERLDLDEGVLPARPCPLYTFWRTAISAEAVTLVYATAYLNSPASMYGHTFLRLSRSTGEGNPLLDYIVNYAADINTNNGFVYAWKGVMGGFPGYFYVMPYYVKVQEYSNMESRDLWEYELSLTRPQVERMVAHAWETRSTHFDYYFFTENCSYQLLTLLEAAAPDLHLSDRFVLQVIPSDTVRVILAQPGLVGRVTARPAILSTMSRRKRLLSGDEIAAAEQWARLPTAASPAPRGRAPDVRQALILDAAYDLMRFREGLKKEPTDDFKQRERKLLLARGRLGVPPITLTVKPASAAPERGHDTARVSAGGGYSNHSGFFQRLTFRPALHDYLDAPTGYPADAMMVMGGLALRFDDQSHRLRLDRVDLLDIVSTLPYDRWVRGPSWKVWAGADNARELGCDGPAGNPHGWSCLYGGVTTGGGLAARLGPGGRALAFVFAGSDLGAGPAFSRTKFRVGLGGEAGVAADATPLWRWQLGGRYFYYPLGETGGHVRASLGEALRLGRNFAWRAGISTAGAYAEVWTELFGYL